MYWRDFLLLSVFCGFASSAACFNASRVTNTSMGCAKASTSEQCTTNYYWCENNTVKCYYCSWINTSISFSCMATNNQSLGSTTGKPCTLPVAWYCSNSSVGMSASTSPAVPLLAGSCTNSLGTQGLAVCCSTPLPSLTSMPSMPSSQPTAPTLRPTIVIKTIISNLESQTIVPSKVPTLSPIFSSSSKLAPSGTKVVTEEQVSPPSIPTLDGTIPRKTVTNVVQIEPDLYNPIKYAPVAAIDPLVMSGIVLGACVMESFKSSSECYQLEAPLPVAVPASKMPPVLQPKGNAPPLSPAPFAVGSSFSTMACVMDNDVQFYFPWSSPKLKLNATIIIEVTYPSGFLSGDTPQLQNETSYKGLNVSYLNMSSPSSSAWQITLKGGTFNRSSVLWWTLPEACTMDYEWRNSMYIDGMASGATVRVADETNCELVTFPNIYWPSSTTSFNKVAPTPNALRRGSSQVPCTVEAKTSTHVWAAAREVDFGYSVMVGCTEGYTSEVGDTSYLVCTTMGDRLIVANHMTCNISKNCALNITNLPTDAVMGNCQNTLAQGSQCELQCAAGTSLYPPNMSTAITCMSGLLTMPVFACLSASVPLPNAPPEAATTCPGASPPLRPDLGLTTNLMINDTNRYDVICTFTLVYYNETDPGLAHPGPGGTISSITDYVELQSGSSAVVVRARMSQSILYDVKVVVQKQGKLSALAASYNLSQQVSSLVNAVTDLSVANMMVNVLVTPQSQLCPVPVVDGLYWAPTGICADPSALLLRGETCDGVPLENFDCDQSTYLCGGIYVPKCTSYPTSVVAAQASLFIALVFAAEAAASLAMLALLARGYRAAPALSRRFVKSQASERSHSNKSKNDEAENEALSQWLGKVKLVNGLWPTQLVLCMTTCISKSIVCFYGSDFWSDAMSMYVVYIDSLGNILLSIIFSMVVFLWFLAGRSIGNFSSEKSQAATVKPLVLKKTLFRYYIAVNALYAVTTVTLLMLFSQSVVLQQNVAFTYRLFNGFNAAVTLALASALVYFSQRLLQELQHATSSSGHSNNKRTEELNLRIGQCVYGSSLFIQGCISLSLVVTPDHSSNWISNFRPVVNLLVISISILSLLMMFSRKVWAVGMVPPFPGSPRAIKRAAKKGSTISALVTRSEAGINPVSENELTQSASV